jgi:hypothetical protein
MSSKLRSVVALVAMALLGWFCATQSQSVAQTKPGAKTGVPHLVQQWEYDDARFDAESAKALPRQSYSTQLDSVAWLTVIS